ncbi:hypothetical protein TrLO_g5317 [Triparma laevis f. longispina]|uniref:Uncharacterized protein n=1 Tax=Triparma laevis f. longispina TaxID=1714387 RepID=A0A9W7FCQ6_9STRA|nr:hypothetical protein TrLO_g5317 [Triparma laevis f. longispina]
MMILAWIYALMNVLSFVSLARIDASTFTIVAQLKVLSTGLFSYLILNKQFSKVKVVALFNLVCGAILVTTPSISSSENTTNDGSGAGGSKFIGILAVALEVTLSGFASIYFEKVVKGAVPSTLVGWLLLDGPLTFVMLIGVGLVLAAIWLYTFDPTPPKQPANITERTKEVEAVPLISPNSTKGSNNV